MAEIVATGFDADQDCSLVAQHAVRMGATFVCRYLKNLTQAEAEALSAHGLKIISIFERRADRALDGAAAGAADGATALAQAAALLQPIGSAIYTTADFPENNAEDDAVMAYFAAFKAAVKPWYKLGVYAEGAVCQRALDAGIADYTWLAGGMGMRGSREFRDSGRATIIQDVGDKAGLGLGIDIDSDHAYVEDYGGWS